MKLVSVAVFLRNFRRGLELSRGYITSKVDSFCFYGVRGLVTVFRFFEVEAKVVVKREGEGWRRGFEVLSRSLGWFLSKMEEDFFKGEV